MRERVLGIKNKYWNKKYSHLLLLSYWIVYLLWFVILEHCQGMEFIDVHCMLDDMIPFCEYFVVAYLFWFIYMGGMLLYTGLKEPESFKKMMCFIIFTFTISMLICTFFPTVQHLRPTQFEHQNVFTWMCSVIYAVDTPTGITPSMHVVGAVGTMLCARDTKRFSDEGSMFWIQLACLLICLSTMFIKQHSAIDTLVAIPIIVTGYYVCFADYEINKKKADKFVRDCEKARLALMREL